MAPGPLTSFSRGGFGYSHRGVGFQRFGAPAASRALGALPGARRQKFYVDDSGVGHFEPGDKLVLEVGDDGDMSVRLEPPENGNGKGNGNGEDKRRGMFGWRNKMAVSTDNNGVVTVKPEGDGVLEIVGDPLSGAITIIQLEPEPLGSNGD